MRMSYLEINNLSIKYNSRDSVALDNLSFNVSEGECIGIIGESGSGKTTLLSAIMQLLGAKAEIKGEILYKGVDLLSLHKNQLNDIRWSEIAIVFQNSLKYLNPSLRILEQISETFKAKKLKVDRKVIEKLFETFNLDRKWLNAYPNELSGGMRQRVFIIMALVLNPRLLLIDEPTTSLENINKNELINYLLYLKNKRKQTMVIVSHDLDVIRKLADRILVMYKGRLLEQNVADNILNYPKHPYTRALIMASYNVNPYKDLWSIKKIDNVPNPSCIYYNYCTQRIDKCIVKSPTYLRGNGVSCIRGGIVEMLSIHNIVKQYKFRDEVIIACDNCSFSLQHGEIVSIIGESGSGKSTLAKIIIGLLDFDSGTIEYNDEEFDDSNKMSIFHGVQIVPQDPYSSLNPKFTVKQAILEPISINKLIKPQEYDVFIQNMLRMVELDELISGGDIISSLSGGQLQRVAIARALSMEPKLLIADEITANLDISTTVNLLRLLKQLQNEKGFSMIFITHDLKIARKISEKMLVMKDGKIIEQGLTNNIFDDPKQEYTQLLVNT